MTEQVKPTPMTQEERMVAARDQIETYISTQYPQWRVIAVKSIRKIILNLKEFYQDEDESNLIPIRNGLMYEAVTQTEQAIEGIFATMFLLKDRTTFIRDVVKYSAGEINKYIKRFDIENLEFIASQLRYPFFPLEEPWEKEDIRERYVDGVLRIQKWLRELKTFHRKYYDDYCQYKHGLSVALNPFPGQGEVSVSLEGGLYTYFQGTLQQYENRNHTLPPMMLNLKPGIQKHLAELLDEGNLLYSVPHVVNVDEVLRITEQACSLLDCLYKNILMEGRPENGFYKAAFPTENNNEHFVIWFPAEKESPSAPTEGRER